MIFFSSLFALPDNIYYYCFILHRHLMWLKLEVNFGYYFLQCLAARSMFENPWVTSSSKTHSMQIERTSNKTGDTRPTYRSKTIHNEL